MPSNSKRQFWAAASAIVLCQSPVVAAAQSPAPSVNPALGAYMKAFDQPRLVKMSDRVYMAFAYDLANFGFIIGDKGVIVIDCGGWSGRTQRALDDLRKVTGKPITHIFYTHGHADHLGGCPTLAGGRPVPVYAHHDYQRYRNEQVSSRLPFIVRRATDQLGYILPKGEAGSLGTGIGPTGYDGTVGYFTPTVLLKGGERLVIDGVTLEIADAPSDNDDSISIWLPDDKVLFAGDAIGGIGPYISTPRNEHGRDPYAFMATLDDMARLPVEYLIAGHGRPVAGRSEVNRVITNNRDIIQFMIDHVVRGMNANISREDIVATFKLPRHLAEDQDLQWHYHRADWMIRGLYGRLAGFYGDDPLDIFALNGNQRAGRFVAALGGSKAALAKAYGAARAGDHAWAGEIAASVLRTEPGNLDAKRLVVASLRRVAFAAGGTSQRNYGLSMAAELEGTLDRSQTRPLLPVVGLLDSVSALEVLRVLTPRLKVKQTSELERSLIVDVTGEGPVTLTIRRSIVRVVSGDQAPGAPRVSIGRADLTNVVLAVISEKMSLAAAVDAGKFSGTGSADARSFFSFFN